MRTLGFLFAFALFIPLLLPERDTTPVIIAPAPVVEASVALQAETPLEAAKAIRPIFKENQNLVSLVNALGILGKEIETPEGRCLTQAVYFEARSEPLEGQLAVAQVVLNRVKAANYPGSICGVVFQNEHIRNRCQFSFACDGLSDNPYNPESWEIARRVSYIALSGHWDDITKSATHYHAYYVSPGWASRLEETGTFGSHIFYRTADAAS